MNNGSPAALVVLHSFGSYSKGDLIVDTAAIKAIIEGGKAGFVIATTVPGPGPSGQEEH